MTKNIDTGWIDDSDYQTALALQEDIQFLLRWKFPEWVNFAQALLKALYVDQNSGRLSDNKIREKLQNIWWELWEIIKEFRLRTWELTSLFSEEVWYKETTPVRLGKKCVYYKSITYWKYTVVKDDWTKRVALALSKDIDAPKDFGEYLSDWIVVQDVHDLQESEIEEMINSIEYRASFFEKRQY